MTSTLVLTIAASLLDFLLKSSLCFVAVLVLVRLILSARLRFAVWFTYLVGSLVYANALAIQILHLLLVSRNVFPVSAPAAAAGATRLGSHALWTLPAAYAPFVEALLAVFVVGYLLAVAVTLTLHLHRQAHLRRALLFAYHPPKVLDALSQSLADELQLPATTVLVLPGLTSPATIGWLHPVVLLPPACEDQPLDQTADILRHELHHILRRDWLLERIACSIRALLFFQPALSAALRHLRIERELACDQAVLAACPDSRLHYAESLLQAARLARQVARGLPESSKRHALELASGIEFAAGASHLETRLRAVLTRPRRYPRGLHALIALTTAVLLIAVSAGLPYLTVTLAFTDVFSSQHALSSAVGTPQPGTDARPAAPKHRPTPAQLFTQRSSVSFATGTHAAMPSMVASTNASALAVIPAAPVVLIASRHEAGAQTRFKLEPAADTEDPLPTSTRANSAAASERDGPLTTSTNPAIKAGSPTHNVVTVLADAAVLLSRHDTGHDDH